MIAITLIDSYMNGRRHLAYTDQGGEVEHRSLHDTYLVTYSAGSIILANEDLQLIVGPIAKAGAVALAERILDGDSRAVTEPQALLILAAAVAGFLDADDETDEPATAVVDLSATELAHV